MKTIKLFLISIFVSMFAITEIYAATSAVKYDEISNGEGIEKNSSGVLGYKIADFMCHSCRPMMGEDAPVKGGIGIFFKGMEQWELGSFGGASDVDGEKYPLSALFTTFTTDDNPEPDEGNNYYLDNVLTASGNTLSHTSGNITVSLTAEPSERGNFIKLNYKITNNGSDTTVNIATFNDIYIGIPGNTGNDNASYELNTHIPTIDMGFNAKTSGKFMSVILSENSGLLSNGGGNFELWTGALGSASSFPNADVINMFKNTGITQATPYTDSAFAYSWSGIAKQGETTFSTLIGLGNNNPVAVNIDENTISPNYDKDNKTFSLTENDANIQIGGTIKDECGMGTCTYTINGSDPIPCDENVYYTSGDSFTTNYMSTINIKEANLKTTGNEYTVTANSVACGTNTATHTFNLSGDIADNPQTGINNNYIILGLILVGGVGIFIYSKKHNKFPQV